VAVKGVRAGEAVGYGARFTADGRRRLAIVPAGYADGLDRRLEGRASCSSAAAARPSSAP
jgi:alanine racemase